MRVADRLARREESWDELDQLVRRSEKRSRGARLGPAEILRLGSLYRSACADLMLAEAHDLPRDAVAYLHALVGRAHNAVYRTRGFDFSRWAFELFSEVPRRLRADGALRVSALIFYGAFFGVALACYAQPELARGIVGDEDLSKMEAMYSGPLTGRDDSTMAGFYIQHNASIGLRCFAWGLAFGLGTIFILLSNAITLGAVFGHMFRSPVAGNFGTFVTAHAPFELTAIVFSGAAGLRLGLGLIAPGPWTIATSLRRSAREALSTAGAATFLFILAAFLEGFVSASPLPYWCKAGIAIVSATMLLLYLLLGGRSRAS